MAEQSKEVHDALSLGRLRLRMSSPLDVPPRQKDACIDDAISVFSQR